MKEAVKRAILRLPFAPELVTQQPVLQRRLQRLARLLRDAASAHRRLAAVQAELANLMRIDPLFVARNRQEFEEALRRVQWPASAHLRRKGAFHLRRFCLCCNEPTRMLVDYVSAYRIEEDGSRTPNWRERLVCERCGMNNRQRLVGKLVQQAVLQHAQPRIYLMEQVTPIYEWVGKLEGPEVHGSEYLGPRYRAGERVGGARHEDVMNLSYPDRFFDLIVSNDVIEHIPDPAKAFRECFRVLKPSGVVLATFPFQTGKDRTVVRARLADGGIEHLLPPQYHGNPVSSDGSLVFHDFGWDLMSLVRDAGFSSAAWEAYASDAFGHMGDGVLVFRLVK